MADDTEQNASTSTTADTGNGSDETSGSTSTDTAPTTETKRSEIPPEVERALRKANKEAEGLRLKLKEFEDRDKTEQQRLAEKATESERETKELREELLRHKVAAAKKLPADLVDRLRGTDEESMAEDADRLLAVFGTKRAPAGDVDQGARSGSEPKWTDADLKTKTAEQIVEARKAGKLAHLL